MKNSIRSFYILLSSREVGRTPSLFLPAWVFPSRRITVLLLKNNVFPTGKFPLFPKSDFSPLCDKG